MSRLPAKLGNTPPRTGSTRSRVLLVRSAGPGRVRADGDEAPRIPPVSLGAIVAAAIVATIWVLGFLGHQLGYATLVRVPDLGGGLGDGLVTGAMLLVGTPRFVLTAGAERPMELLAAFLALSIPAGALAAARPATRGGPRPKRAFAVIAGCGVAGVILFALLTVAWFGAPIRSALLAPLPLDAAESEAWQTGLEIAAGFDALAVVAIALWVVLAFRLPVPTWARALGATAAIFALVVAAVGAATSGASAAHAGAVRSLGRIEGVAGARLVLGATPHHVALLSDAGAGRSEIELRRRDETMVVERRQSIAGFLREVAAAPIAP